MKDLDNLGIYDKIDRSYMGSILLNFAQQYHDASRLAADFKLPESFSSARNIVISGMGGSAISGDLLRSLFSATCPVPIVLNRNYSVPEFVNEDTLFIAVSYSGNTEETLAAFTAAREKNAKVMSISTGGKLAKLSQEIDAPHFSVAARGMQPRCAFGHIFTPIVVFMSKLGFIADYTIHIEEVVELLWETAKTLAPEVPAKDNEAKQIAKLIYEKLPVVYASQNYFDVVAMRWKGQFNENSKSMAFNNVIPEMNHNEIVGWGIPAGLTRQCVAIFLCDDTDSEKIKKRIEITRDLISEEAQVITVQVRGGSPLVKALYLIYLGDFASYYLAMLNGVDPTPIARIDLFKSKLGQ